MKNLSVISASYHSNKNRQADDYYATEPKAAELLLKLESFNNILEPACGAGHLSKVFLQNGIKTESSDLVRRGFGKQINFFDITKWSGDIITNPPYKHALAFVEHSLNIIKEHGKVAMLLRVQFLEGRQRKIFFKKYPPKIIWISSSRLSCAKNANFKRLNERGGSAVAFAWWIWEKGYDGETIINWFN